MASLTFSSGACMCLFHSLLSPVSLFKTSTGLKTLTLANYSTVGYKNVLTRALFVPFLHLFRSLKTQKLSLCNQNINLYLQSVILQNVRY